MGVRKARSTSSRHRDDYQGPLDIIDAKIEGRQVVAPGADAC